MTPSEEAILQIQYLFCIVQDQNQPRNAQIRAKENITMKLEEHCRVIRKKYNLNTYLTAENVKER